MGFFTQLAPLFGGSHAFAADGRRFAHFVSQTESGQRVGGALADALVAAWAQMQADVERDAPDGPLALPVADAGRGGGGHLQRQLTAQRERAAVAELERRYAALPLRDDRRVPYYVCDRASRSFLTTWTKPEWLLTGGAFEDHLAVYMGWPSPLVLPRAGHVLRRSRDGSVLLGEHGWELVTAYMPGDDWGTQHNAVARAVIADTAAAGICGDRTT